MAKQIRNCIVCGWKLEQEDTGETTCEECKKTPLEPCPFCGMPAKIYMRRCCFWIVCCRDTKCPGHNMFLTYRCKNEAISKWNRRYYKRNGEVIV